MVRLGILTVVMIVVWVALDILIAIKKKPETEIPEEILRQFEANLNISTLEGIRQKNYFEEGAANVFQAPQTPPTAFPSPTPSPLALPSPSQSPSATPGATP